MPLPPLQTCASAVGTISYREQGVGGDALVFLHGVGSGSASWERQLAHFGKRRRVLAWEAPGYGRSEPLEGEAPRAAAYAEALEAFRAALGIERWHVVGHSMGGLIAAVYAAHHAERVRTLTLSHPARGLGGIREAERAQAMLARLAALDDLGMPAFADRFAPQLVAPDAPAAVLERVRTVMAGLNPQGYRQALRMLMDADIFAHLAAVRAPALVLWGRADRIASESDMQAIAQALPGADYRVLEGVAHAPYLEAPDAYNALIAEHIAHVS